MRETTTATAERDTADQITTEPDDTAASVDDAEPESLPAQDLTDDTKTTAPRWRRWLPQRVDALLLLMVVVSTVFAAIFGWKLHTHNDIDAAGAQALAAAQQYAVTLTSIDSDHIDTGYAAAMNGATGGFKDMYTKSADQLKPLLIQAKSVSKGRVVAASVQSASKNQVVVMLFVDAEITNVTNPTPRVDRNRILMTMDRVGDRWLASKVDLP
ncbi:hypothetical protein OG874_12225 [Nocardia sp. NBC_00565]|uniref:hypothetical protein n=1 Tax=Nocardia sp. NBC_00565 TaxID=2975993 RepID=UPI002E811785|nr:hypothetical protein [Nocardia sp. NBC_00565]WUC05850.1 hypothetical protein OG874_12225 [Nocardia sp. NBC_00565]